MASRDSIVERLKPVPLFARCSAKDLRHIARHLKVVSMVPGRNVVCAGEHGEDFFVILSGEATVHRNGRVAGRLGPGDHFGELALLDPAPRAATVRAATNLEIGTIARRAFVSLLHDVPGVADGLLASMASQLREAKGVKVIT